MVVQVLEQVIVERALRTVWEAKVCSKIVENVHCERKLHEIRQHNRLKIDCMCMLALHDTIIYTYGPLVYLNI